MNQPSPGSPAPGLGDPVAAMFAEPDDEPQGDDGTSLVLAAGSICWRVGQDGAGLELLLVRSARWGDWSWPKGKLEAGESLPECAVREVREETGVRVTLGVPLPTVSYVLPDGRDKAVRYWAGQVLDQTPQSPDAAEITDVAWLSVPAALERLTRPGDRAPLDQLLDLADRDRLRTRPLLVLRHAKAKSRANWSGEEADRPLTGRGRRQAEAVAGLLACWEPERLLSSPWARCVQTLQPYLDRFGAARAGRRLADSPELLPLLSEQGLRNNPARIGQTLTELLNGEHSALLCTHRPVLEAVVEALAESTGLAVRDQLPDADPWLSPAEVLVLHISDQRQLHRVTHRVHSVERYRGESGRTLLA